MPIYLRGGVAINEAQKSEESGGADEDGWVINAGAAEAEASYTFEDISIA